MDLPVLFVLNTIPSDKFSIIHFKDLRHKKDSPAHFHVLVPIKEKSFLCLCIITKQFFTMKNLYADEEEALNSLVHLETGSFKFLNAPQGSVINCNSAELLTREQLESHIDKKIGVQIKAFEDSFTEDLKFKIKNDENFAFVNEKKY